MPLRFPLTLRPTLVNTDSSKSAKRRKDNVTLRVKDFEGIFFETRVSGFAALVYYFGTPLTLPVSSGKGFTKDRNRKH